MNVLAFPGWVSASNSFGANSPTLHRLVHVFFFRATNCGTIKNKYEVLAPNIRRTVFQHSNFLNEFESLSTASATIQTHNQRASNEWCDHVSSRVRVVCVAGKRSWSRDRSQNFGVDFHSKQIWKRCCKKSVLHYNAIPSLTLIAIYKVLISGLLLIVKVYQLSSLSRNCPETFHELKLRCVSGAWHMR